MPLLLFILALTIIAPSVIIGVFLVVAVVLFICAVLAAIEVVAIQISEACWLGNHQRVMECKKEGNFQYKTIDWYRSVYCPKCKKTLTPRTLIRQERKL